jgi:uncharacterized protein (DUF2384 family)
MSSFLGATPAEGLAGQLEHPTAGAIWNRAVEVFGNEAKGAKLDGYAARLAGRSPQDLVATGDAAEQRLVLEVLLRIDYGVFS